MKPKNSTQSLPKSRIACYRQGFADGIRSGPSAGGLAAAASMTPEQRSERARKAAQAKHAKWIANNPKK